MRAICLFVYGTLRPGMYNHTRMGLEAVEVIRNCQANGVMHNVGGNRPVYPTVNFDKSGLVQGDILVLDLDDAEVEEALESTHQMEVGAGYEVRSIKVMTPEGNMVECTAYHYPREPRGLAIPDGNWLKFAGQEA